MTENAKPTPEQVLALHLPDNDSGATTVRGYLAELIRVAWEEKRPFGNSGWHYDIYIPMINAGWVNGRLDEDGYIEECDDKAAYALIDTAIRALGGAS